MIMVNKEGEGGERHHHRQHHKINWVKMKTTAVVESWQRVVAAAGSHCSWPGWWPHLQRVLWDGRPHQHLLSSGWRSPPTSFLQHLRRSGEPAGGARRGMEVQREELLFLSDDLISVTGASSWWGYFAQWGGGHWFNQEEWIHPFSRVKKFMHFDCLPSSLITFTFLYSCLHVFASVLDKDSSELKVLAISINSKAKQAFECNREQSSSSWIIQSQMEV